MVDLTVAQVAGIINIAVVILQLTFPLAVVLVLVGTLDDIHNAITWSVVGNVINGSYWSTLLQTDTTASSLVNKKVRFFSLLSTSGIIFLAAVSVVTPLGLYDAISQSNYDDTRFEYAADTTSMGKATPSRDGYRPGRTCGQGNFELNCPGQAAGWEFYLNGTEHWMRNLTTDPYISTVIASNITEIFSSGLSGDRLNAAGAFDIEYRSFIVAADPRPNSTLFADPDRIPINYDQYRPRTRGKFHTFQTYILNEDYETIEGLIVNSKTGGVGFRNHTIPVTPGEGAEWTEGILWMEPETVCVSSNITIDFQIDSDGESSINAVLTDRGGFVNLQKNYPYIDVNDTQLNPDLYGRAHKGAVLNNFNLMTYFNTSRNGSSIGKTFRLPSSGSFGFSPSRLSITNFGYDSDAAPVVPGYSLNLEYHSFYSNYSNPYLKTSFLSRGFGNGDFANISNVLVGTGAMLGAAHQTEPGNGRFNPGTNWTAPIYSCATAIKVYIMDVSFMINGTSALSNLKVMKAQPRSYASNATTPLWAVENTGMLIGEVNPFWGLVDNIYEDWPSLWTIRKDHLYLPASKSIFGSILSSFAAHASAEAPANVLGITYSESSSGYNQGLFDYSAQANYPLFLKWQNLTLTADTSSSVINLIWTDIMANFVVGTRSQLGSLSAIFPNSSIQSNSTLVRVARFSHTIQYQIVYAIPAFIFVLVYLTILISSIIMLIKQRVGFRALKSLLNRTTVGRAITTERHGHSAGIDAMSTRDWIETYGMEDVGIRKRLPRSDTGFKTEETESLRGKNTSLSDMSGSMTADVESPDAISTPAISDREFKIKRKPLLRSTEQRYEIVGPDVL